jgi:hypothetical protein
VIARRGVIHDRTSGRIAGIAIEEPPVSGDAGLLRGFLNDLDGVVWTALSEVDGIVADDVRSGLERLWSDASRSRDVLDRELEAVEQGTDLETAGRLIRAGLTGGSLEFKLAMFGRRRDEFEGERAAGVVSRRLRALFKSLLRWADVILGSLVAAIPGGEAYKEAKEAVEAAVEDAEDEDLQ